MTQPAPRFVYGDPVKRYDVEHGWRFGRVISTHYNTSLETWMAAVRWIRGEEPEWYSQVHLEAYPGEPGSFRLGDKVQNIEDHWQGQVIDYEWIDGTEMLVCNYVYVSGALAPNDKRWFDPRDMRLIAYALEAKLSEGPWTVQTLSDGKKDYPNWKTYAVRDKKNHCIAVVGEVDRGTEFSNAANAMAMAASSEMIAALRKIMSNAAASAEIKGIAGEAIATACGRIHRS